MPSRISHLAHVDPRAELGSDVEIGPFCVVGPDVVLGDACRLASHVTVIGRTRIGRNNRFCAGSVIGGDPQDLGYRDAPTSVEIGDNNVLREGVTVNRGAEKEDGITRIGDRNILMANCHVAHNCHIFNNVILVNGVLLGGHVYVHDGAIVSGNSVVHHYSTLGTLSFVSGGCRVPHDIPPYMLAAGSDNPELKTINVVGMQRAGLSQETIRLIKRAFRLLFRERRKVQAVRDEFGAEFPAALPRELATLLDFVEFSQAGRLGRGREAQRTKPADVNDRQISLRRAA